MSHVHSIRSTSRIKVPALKQSFKEKQTKKVVMKAIKEHENQLKENAAHEKQVQTKDQSFFFDKQLY